MAVITRGFQLLRCMLAIGIGAMATVPTAAPAATGRTTGSFDVTSTGAATYSVPVFVPPGPRGVQPNVALTYSSSAGVGYLGRGWSLSGFSSISRCRRTLAQDGAAASVALQTSDGYCLDGNRLKRISGTYGSAGSVYGTEIADFSRITAEGAAGNGPAYWVVQRKDGLIYTYGGTTDSRVLATGHATATKWMLNEIRDRDGNKVIFTYKAADSATTGTTHPVRIQWTQTSGIPPILLTPT